MVITLESETENITIVSYLTNVFKSHCKYSSLYAVYEKKRQTQQWIPFKNFVTFVSVSANTHTHTYKFCSSVKKLLIIFIYTLYWHVLYRFPLVNYTALSFPNMLNDLFHDHAAFKWTSFEMHEKRDTRRDTSQVVRVILFLTKVDNTDVEKTTFKYISKVKNDLIIFYAWFKLMMFMYKIQVSLIFIFSILFIF